MSAPLLYPAARQTGKFAKLLYKMGSQKLDVPAGHFLQMSAWVYSATKQDLRCTDPERTPESTVRVARRKQGFQRPSPQIPTVAYV
jgi:hypothetical protein